MNSVEDYIANYSSTDIEHIEFAWNGKHAGEFNDGNQEFRQSVVKACVEGSKGASVALLQYLFIEEAKWAREAWGSPKNFGQLGQLLLECGTEDAVRTFAVGMNYSFDTFGACHEITLSSENLQKVIAIIDKLLSSSTEDERHRQYESAKELFTKIGEGSATQGWAKVEPGTTVTNVKVVKPNILQRLKGWLNK